MQDIEEDKRVYVPNGVWDISDIEYVIATKPYLGKWDNTQRKRVLSDADNVKLNEWQNKLDKFTEKYPDYVVANAYQCEYPIYLAKLPTVKVAYDGSGFNYGSTNIITNCPKTILILAEND